MWTGHGMDTYTLFLAHVIKGMIDAPLLWLDLFSASGPASAPSLQGSTTIKWKLAKPPVDIVMGATEPLDQRVSAADVRRKPFDVCPKVPGTFIARVHVAKGRKKVSGMLLLLRTGTFGVVCGHGVQKGPGGASQGGAGRRTRQPHPLLLLFLYRFLPADGLGNRLLLEGVNVEAYATVVAHLNLHHPLVRSLLTINIVLHSREAAPQLLAIAVHTLRVKVSAVVLSVALCQGRQRRRRVVDNLEPEKCQKCPNHFPAICRL
jgi:hypothetical protein